MVLEAATQVFEADNRGVQVIKSFTLHDVALQAALVVPEDDQGVEVLLTLQPVALNITSNYEHMYEFCITSVTSSNRQEPEDRFIEHSRGRVRIGLNSAGKSGCSRHTQSIIIQQA